VNLETSKTEEFYRHLGSKQKFLYRKIGHSSTLVQPEGHEKMEQQLQQPEEKYFNPRIIFPTNLSFI
jgi:hypothetical protein